MIQPVPRPLRQASILVTLLWLAALLTAVSVPLASVMSLLSNPVTASEKVMVRVLVSPTASALSDMTTLATTGSLVSMA